MKNLNPQNDTDVKLMLLFTKGDESAFGQLIAKHSKGLINYFYRQGVHREMAEDFCHEVFIKIYEYRHQYSPQAKFTTLLYRIAHNHFIDHCRRTRNKPNLYSIHETSEDEGSTSLEERLKGKEKAPLEHLLEGELQKTLENALEKLSPEHREVFLLSEIQGLKYAEISEILNIPVGTVKSRMFNSLQKLRNLLEEKLS
jgi:RNA polymerase sigma-70 factor (ECF subfamily)